MKRREPRYFYIVPLIAAFVVAGWLGWQPARAEGESKELQAVAQALGKSKLSLLAGIGRQVKEAQKPFRPSSSWKTGSCRFPCIRQKRGWRSLPKRMCFRS